VRSVTETPNTLDGPRGQKLAAWPYAAAHSALVQYRSVEIQARTNLGHGRLYVNLFTDTPLVFLFASRPL
jgi:hypothetical protein